MVQTAIAKSLNSSQIFIVPNAIYEAVDVLVFYS